MTHTPTERLAQAIRRAVDEHGCPNSFGFRELEEYGAPLPTTAGLLLKTRKKEIEALCGMKVKRIDKGSYVMILVTKEEQV